MTATIDVSEDALQRVRELIPLIGTEADQAETDGTLTPAVVDAMRRSGLFRIMAPRCLGGAEAPVPTVYQVIEELAKADGSASWSFMATAVYLGTAGSLLGDSAVEKIFSDPNVSIAGQLAPLGTAIPIDGGFTVEGRFGFASGAMHASWLFGGYRELVDGEQVRLDSGLPRIHGVLVPREQVEYLGNWNVIGLRATGSVDFQVPQQDIPAEYTFSTLEDEPLRGGPLMRLGPSGMTAIGHSAFATGVARTALDQLKQVAGSKRRLGRKGLIDDPYFQNQYARAEASLGSARAYALATLSELGEAAEADAITPEVRARARLATTHACHCARDVISFAFQQSGSTGLRNGSILQRCYRDISAGEQHVFTDHNTYRDASLALLGIAPPTLQL